MMPIKARVCLCTYLCIFAHVHNSNFWIVRSVAQEIVSQLLHLLGWNQKKYNLEKSKEKSNFKKKCFSNITKKFFCTFFHFLLSVPTWYLLHSTIVSILSTKSNGCIHGISCCRYFKLQLVRELHCTQNVNFYYRAL